MVERLLIGAADIHAGPAAYRLEPFQHLYVGGGIALIAIALQSARLCGLRGHLRFELVKKVLHLVLGLGHRNSSRISRIVSSTLPTPVRGGGQSGAKAKPTEAAEEWLPCPPRASQANDFAHLYGLPPTIVRSR